MRIERGSAQGAASQPAQGQSERQPERLEYFMGQPVSTTMQKVLVAQKIDAARDTETQQRIASEVVAMMVQQLAARVSTLRLGADGALNVDTVNGFNRKVRTDDLGANLSSELSRLDVDRDALTKQVNDAAADLAARGDGGKLLAEALQKVFARDIVNKGWQPR